MARKRRKKLSMRKVREILRLSMQCNIGNQDIAQSLCVSHLTYPLEILDSRNPYDLYKI